MQETKTYEWALTGIFAAFHLVLSMVPLYLLGIGGGFISWGLVSAPIVGFLLGPVYGLISVLIGSILGTVFFNIGGILGPIIPIFAPTVSAFVAGSIRVKRFYVVPATFLMGIALYLLGPIGRITMPYLWLHIIAAILSILLMLPMLKERFGPLLDHAETKIGPESAIFVWLGGFLALMADHLIGATLSQYYFFYVLGFDTNSLAASYMATMFLYPIERILASAIVGFVLVILTVAISHSSLPLPQVFEDDNGTE